MDDRLLQQGEGLEVVVAEEEQGVTPCNAEPPPSSWLRDQESHAMNDHSVEECAAEPMCRRLKND